VIALARVDDRLVHGQVTVGWVPHLHATRLIVANDRIAADPLLSGIIRAGTAGLALEILGVTDAVRRSLGGEWAGDRVLLLFETLQDALRAVEAGLPLAQVNLGGLRHEEGRVCLCDGVTLDREDCETLRALTRRGVKIDVRLMPLDRACPLPEQLQGGKE